eukprot:TRINITY_DN8271_c0_g1_i1.p2 TRINITY_DN8271_c0_g1~~TRINITY_DN8271_c0_g1_i1.p2  ORF type:complete len:176 (+),score=29.15 TRINITY_DN8271_c0_g1_i1:98-625(+)
MSWRSPVESIWKPEVRPAADVPTGGTPWDTPLPEPTEAPKSITIMKRAPNQRPASQQAEQGLSPAVDRGIVDKERQYHQARQAIFDGRKPVPPKTVQAVKKSGKGKAVLKSQVDTVDPDYDRSYTRYVKRFEPGFNVEEVQTAENLPAGVGIVQPAVTYDTEFPNLGGRSTGKKR